MNLRKSILLTLISLIGLMLSACVAAVPADGGDSGGEMAGFVPTNPECIAPADPGGGWDFTCRVPAAQVMPEIGVVDSMKVTNMSGGGGAIAMANVTSQRNDDENLIVAASLATASRFAANAYPVSPDDIRWLGAVGADFGVVAVKADSPIETLDDLVASMQKDPTALTHVGGSDPGSIDHIKLLLLAKAAGVEDITQIKYIGFQGGGTALIEIAGERGDVFSGDTSEVLGDLDAGNVRILAVFAPDRIERLGDVPTALELGYDVVVGNWRGFYAPGGISDEAYDYWVDAIQQVSSSEEWATARAEGGLAPFESFGADFESFARAQIAETADILRELGVIE